MREREREGWTEGNWGTGDERSWLKKKKEGDKEKGFTCVRERKMERQSMESRNVSKSI